MLSSRTQVMESLDRRTLFSATVTFQDGVNGFAGTEDTYVSAEFPTTSFANAAKIQVDGDARSSIAGNQPSHGLVRFNNLFGDGPGQVPIGATITSATLTLVTGSATSDNSGSLMSLRRMLSGWDESSTWNSTVNGISGDGTEAAASSDASFTPATLGAAIPMNVTATVQAWANDPASNLGWAILPSGTDGWWGNASEATGVSGRPRLSITYETDPGPVVNEAPEASAGPDLAVTFGNPASLNGTVTDDGLPQPPALQTLWEQVDGPGVVTFGNAADVDTTASFSEVGTYVLRLTASDGELSDSDEVTVTVSSQPPPTFGALDPINLSANTGEKPQSKVWEHQGKWWSVLPTSSGTWLWRLDGSTWTSVLRLSTTTGTKADVLSTGDVAHILLYKGTSSTRLASIEYVPGGEGTYRMWSQRTSLASISLSSGVEIATLALDGAGRMWVASDAGTTVQVRYSDAPYSSWSSPITVATGTSSDDISAITSLPDGRVGVMWSNQVTRRFGFKTHAAGASPSAWSADEVPASQSALNVGAGMADDHVNLAVASDGTVYAAVKTSYDTSGRPAVALLVRRPNGTWDDLYTVDSIGNTRPIVVLNESAGQLRVFYTFNNDSGLGDIVYKESSMSNISFSSKTTLMDGSFNNASSARVANNGSLVVIAAGSSNRLGGVHMAWAATAPAFAGRTAGTTAPSSASRSASLFELMEDALDDDRRQNPIV